MSGKRLGRGLDALLSRTQDPVIVEESVASHPNEHAVGDAPSEAAGSATQATSDGDDVQMLPLDVIHRSPFQPRRTFDQAALNELASSIKRSGLLQPIVVRVRPAGGYELIAGERRWRAAQLAELPHLPALVKDVSDEEASALALIENIQREDLKPLEEAQALVRLREEFGLTHEEVADAVGKSRTAVTNLMRLLNLTPKVRELLEMGQLEAGHARALLTLPEQLQEEAAARVISRKLSVRDTERLAKRLQKGTDDSQPAASSRKDADTLALERDLTERLGAPVVIEHGSSGKGTLTVRYSSLDQLDGVLRHLR